MNVAELSHGEILDALDEIIANTVSCINDHELGTDGCGKNVRAKIIQCLEAKGGKNNGCTHCGRQNFPTFPSHDIVERAIELIPDTNKEKINIEAAHNIINLIRAALDIIRIMSLRRLYSAAEVEERIEELKAYSGWSSYVKYKIKKIKSLQKKAVAMCDEKDPDKKQLMNEDFLNNFTAEKKHLTDFRIEILKKIKEFLSS